MLRIIFLNKVLYVYLWVNIYFSLIGNLWVIIDKIKEKRNKEGYKFFFLLVSCFFLSDILLLFFLWGDGGIIMLLLMFLGFFGEVLGSKFVKELIGVLMGERGEFVEIVFGLLEVKGVKD